MNKDSSLDNNPMEDSQDSEETCEMFKDVPKCLSEEEWTKLENADELSYVYMKKRYDFMTALGLMPIGPNFIPPTKQTPKSPEHDSDETQNPGNHDFPDTSGVFQDVGNVYQQRPSLLYHLFTNKSPEEASHVQPKKHLKMVPVKEAREQNKLKLPPVTPDSEPAPKKLCPSGKGKASGQLRKKKPDFPDTSGVFQDVGNVYQQRPSLLYHLFTNKSPEEASHVQPKKHLKALWLGVLRDSLVSLQDHSTPRGMNRESSLDNNPMKGSQDSEEKCKAFKDIRKYFTEEEWAKLRNSEKRTCVCMKRNYEIMTGLGLMTTCPDFMRPKNWTTKSGHDSDEDWNPGNEGPFQAAAPVLELTESKKEETHVWVGRLRERKDRVVYQEISDPEDDD
ncbi:PREDICTED: uncharacterized protein LOC102245725 [Myotis brandtii]|uniref:uncharacterized protein LOC102245725 n=1 Tax=Myotis brandtii TaxID=109478 RepID=UPI000703EDD9|nr:PREDICTED: uncharacterized protein LOC102245725 [Myotis brandtii]